MIRPQPRGRVREIDVTHGLGITNAGSPATNARGTLFLDAAEQRLLLLVPLGERDTIISYSVRCLDGAVATMGAQITLVTDDVESAPAGTSLASNNGGIWATFTQTLDAPLGKATNAEAVYIEVTNSGGSGQVLIGKVVVTILEY
jgi:hypothetical protein